MAYNDEEREPTRSIEALEREVSFLHGRIDHLCQQNRLLEGPLYRLIAHRLRAIGDRLTGGGIRNLGRRLVQQQAQLKKSSTDLADQLTPEAQAIYLRLNTILRRDRPKLHEDSH